MKANANRCRRRLCAAALAAALMPASAWSQAANWPTKPVILVTPASAGGPTDTVARALGLNLSNSIGQPVVVENKGGALGTIGGAYVARAEPDGYTQLLGIAASTVVAPHLIKLRFDPLKDTVPVAMVATGPSFIWVPSDSPIRNLNDLLAAIRAEPRKFNYSAGLVGTLQHLASLQLFDAAGVKPVHVGYKGSAPAATDFLGGVFPFYIDMAQTMVPYFKAGRVRPIVVLAQERSQLLPEVPSLAESGFKGIDASPFFVLMVPAGTPDAVIQRMNKEVRAAQQTEEFRRRLANVYQEVVDPGDPANLGDVLRARSAQWSEVIRKHGIKAE